MLEEIINNIQSDTIIHLGKKFIDVDINKINGKFEYNTVYGTANMIPDGDTDLAIFIMVSLIENEYKRIYWYINDNTIKFIELGKINVIDYKSVIRKEKIKNILSL